MHACVLLALAVEILVEETTVKPGIPGFRNPVQNPGFEMYMCEDPCACMNA